MDGMMDDDKTMTVGELIAALSAFSPELPVRALWDCVPNFSVHRVKPFGPAVLLDCGAGPNGDWFIVAKDIQVGRYGREGAMLNAADAQELADWLKDD